MQTTRKFIARTGKLSADELAHRSPDFVAFGNKTYPEQLAKLGDVKRVQLMNCEKRCDDRIYTYDIEFATKSIRLTLAHTQDGKGTRYGWRDK